MIKYSELTCITRNYKLKYFDFNNKFKYLLLNSGEAKGYYSRGNFLFNQSKLLDFHLFLVVKKGVSCFQDIVIREGVKLSKKFDLAKHIAPGQIIFENKPTLVVRIRPVEFENLNLIIEALQKHGIEFVKNKKVQTFETKAFYKKYYEFKELADGIYQEDASTKRFFIKMPKSIEFEEFKKLIKEIECTSKFHLFEYFLAELYHKNTIINFAGVFSSNCIVDNFEVLKSELEKRLK